MPKPSRRNHAKVALPPNPVKPSYKETYPSNEIPYTNKNSYESEYVQLPNGSVVPLHDALPNKGAPPARSCAKKPRYNLVEGYLNNLECRPREERNLERDALISGVLRQNDRHWKNVVHGCEKDVRDALKATKEAKKAAGKALKEKSRWQRSAKLLGYLLAIALLLLWLQWRRLSLLAEIGESTIPGQFSWVLRTPTEMLAGWKNNLTGPDVDWEGRFAAKTRIWERYGELCAGPDLDDEEGDWGKASEQLCDMARANYRWAWSQVDDEQAKFEKRQVTVSS